jgi:hypothetical protein
MILLIRPAVAADRGPMAAPEIGAGANEKGRPLRRPFLFPLQFGILRQQRC